MIDLSIVVATWNSRGFLPECLANRDREDPALMRIEYHRSLCRFFRRNRGRSCMAMVFVLRIAKSLFYATSQALQAGARR